MYVYIYVCVYEYLYAYIHVDIYTYIYVCVYVWISIYIYMCNLPPTPQTLNLDTWGREGTERAISNIQPYTLNPEPYTPNPKPWYLGAGGHWSQCGRGRENALFRIYSRKP